ncbi:hypothetical protein ACFLZU_03765 [Thermodesulfobacteriota bacterium]
MSARKGLLDKYRETDIVKLNEELSDARSEIISLMPEEIQSVLRSYHHCESKDERTEWFYHAVNKIIEMAKPLSEIEDSITDGRANCPLCGAEAHTPYSRGFSLPRGLDQHLKGKGHSYECSVMHAARELAKDYFYRKFRKQDEEEEVQKQLDLDNRKKTETLYLTGPNHEPKLLETDRFSRVCRNNEELIWAEKRLKDLRFNISSHDNIKSYIKEDEQCIVFADLRDSGRINFAAYKKPLPKPSRKKRRHYLPHGNFYILDSWKYDIVDKYEKRYQDSIKHLFK